MNSTRSILAMCADTELRALLRLITEPGGHWIREANSLEEAQGLVGRHHFDLVITTELLTDGGGVELGRWLRSWNAQLPILFFGSIWREAPENTAIEEELAPCVVRPLPAPAGALRESLGDALRRGGVAPRNPGGLVLSALALESLIEHRRPAASQRLEKRVHDLAGVLARGRMQGLDPQELYRVHRLCAELHAAAGLYGLMEMAVALGKLELLFQRLTLGEITDFQSFWAQLDEALDRARGRGPRALEAEAEPDPAATARVLVLGVDDDDVQALANAASRELVEIWAAKGLADGLPLARKLQPDVLLVDLDLGGPGGGVHLSRKLRGIDGAPEASLGFLSRRLGVKLQVAAARAGGELFLPNPPEPREFLNAVRLLLAARRQEPLRVLAVHNGGTDHLTPLEESDGVEVTRLDDPLRAPELLDLTRFDVVLADSRLPSLSGPDLVRLLRTTPRWQDLPVVLRVARGDAHQRAEALRAGADEVCLDDETDPPLLERVRLRAERHRRARELHDRDPLTGLLSRQVFTEQLAARLGEARRSGRPVSVVHLSLDLFRELNELHGLTAGDNVLMGLGKLLTTRFRVEDLRGRWGGAEFMVALCGAGPQDALMVIGGLLHDLQETAFDAGEGVRVRATFSAGVASTVEAGDSVEGLIRSAAEQLRLARATGPGTVLGASRAHAALDTPQDPTPRPSERRPPLFSPLGGRG